MNQTTINEKGGAWSSPADRLFSLLFYNQTPLFIKNETRIGKSSQVYLFS